MWTRLRSAQSVRRSSVSCNSRATGVSSSARSTSNAFWGTASLSARVIGRFGAYRVLLAGLVLITGGMALLSRAPAHGSYVTDVLPPMLLLSAGFAAAMPPLTGLAMTGAREEDAGLASGLFNTTQIVGGSLGLAVLSTLAATRTDGLLARGVELIPATAEGYRLAFRVATVIAGGALTLAAAALRGRRD